MPHALLPVLQDNLPVRLPASHAECLAPFNHDEERGRACHADERSRNETVLVPHVVDPGGYTRTNQSQ